MAHDAGPGGCGRRALLRGCLVAACAPAAGQLVGCAPWVAAPVAIDLPAPVDDVASVLVSRVPELSAPGGNLLLRPDALDELGRPLSLLVVHSGNSAGNAAAQNPSGLYAFGAYCPHAGCEVAWDEASTQVVCPCHLSRFSLDGTVVNPPAQQSLETYPVKLDATKKFLQVNLGGSAGIFPAVQGGVVSFPLSALPALAPVGGSVTGRSQGVPYPLLVMRTGASELRAFDARCPHLGCSVQGAQSYLICPCHGSVFGLDGAVKTGPAVSGLAELLVTVSGGTVQVKIQ